MDMRPSAVSPRGDDGSFTTVVGALVLFARTVSPGDCLQALCHEREPVRNDCRPAASPVCNDCEPTTACVCKPASSCLQAATRSDRLRSPQKDKISVYRTCERVDHLVSLSISVYIKYLL